MSVDPDARLGPLVGKTQQKKVLGFIRRALDAGVTSATGDGTFAGDSNDVGCFVKPVIFVDVDTETEVPIASNEDS